MKILRMFKVPPLRSLIAIISALFLFFAVIDTHNISPFYFNFTFNKYALLSLFEIILNIILLVALYSRKGNFHTRNWFAICICGFIFLGFSEVFERMSINAEQALFWSRFGLLGLAIIPVGFYMFAYYYTNKKYDQRDALIPAMLISTGVIFLSLVINDSSINHIKDSLGPWGYGLPLTNSFVILSLWLTSIILLGIQKFISYYYESTDIPHKRQARIIIVFAIMALSGGILGDVIPHALGFYFIPLGILFQSLLPVGVIYAIYYYDTFAIDFSILATDIFDTLNEGIFITDTDYNIQIMSHYALELSGYTEQQLSGGNIDQLFETSNYKNIQSSFQEKLKKSDLAEINDTYLINKSGKPIAINLSITKLKGQVPAYLFVVIDISELKQSNYLEQKTNQQLKATNANYQNQQKAMLNLLEDSRVLSEQLKQEKESVEKKVTERTADVKIERSRLQASINSLNIGFIIVDVNKHILNANGAFRAIIGDGDTAIVPGLEQLALKLKDSFDINEALDTCFKTRKNINKDNIQMGAKAIRIFIAPIFDENDEKTSFGAVVLVEDISEAKAVERSRDEFFSIASHELRTPLTAIRGNTQMIKEYYKEQLSDPSLNDMVNDIHDSSIRLITIVNDFLDTSRLEQGKISFKLTDFDCKDLVEEVVAEFKAGEISPELYLKVDITNSTLPFVHADRDRLKQVILNLIGNALKFTEKGGVTVKLSVKSTTLIVEVTDTGKGIPEESRNLLFRKFQQASNNILTRDSTRSTGLGLYISKLIIEGMGGKIYLGNTAVNTGSTFTIEVPTVVVAR